MKKGLKQFDAIESCSIGAICMVSALLRGTMQSKECRKRKIESNKSQAVESVADQDEIRRRERPSELPVEQREMVNDPGRGRAV